MATMMLPLYILITLVLVGIAIYGHVTATTLSLPIPSALTILNILLPLFPGLSAFVARLLLLRSANRAARNNPGPNGPNPSPNHNRNSQARKPPYSLAPSNSAAAHAAPTPTPTPTIPLLFALLAPLLLTTALVTLHAHGLAAGAPLRTCLLARRWQALFSAHDARAIRAVQDALGCCGLRSTRDMAWPFPGRGGAGAGACEEQFARREPCLGRWGAELRRVGAVGVGVGAVVGAVQVLMLAAVVGMMMSGGLGRGRRVVWWEGGGRGKGDGAWWSVLAERLLGPGMGLGAREMGQNGESVGVRRPLLAGAVDVDAAEEEEEVREGGRRIARGYHDVEVQADYGEDEAREEEGISRSRIGQGDGYGAVGAGPRIEPSHHDPWAGAERC